MKLPEWANWLARDEDGSLMVFERKPHKDMDDFLWSEPENYGDSISFDETNRVGVINETDDTFSHIKWTDEEPTEVERGLEASGISAEELNRIMNAKAHGYDSVPEVADKDEVETTSISFEEAMALVENRMENETATTHTNNNTNTNKDMVNQPNHYIGEYGLEVEDVLRNFIPRYTDPYVGHRIASAIEYLLRSPLKNGQQDIEKARKNLDQALGYMEKKELK